MAYTITVGAGETNGLGVSQTPALPAGTLTGKLLLIVSSCTGSSADTRATPATPSGYTILYSLAGADPLAVWGKIGEAGEAAPTIDVWNASNQSCVFMVAIESPNGWPAIANVLATAVSVHQPTNGAGSTYPAHTVAATGNCLYRVGVKWGGTTGLTISSAALTSGYTAGGFAKKDNASNNIAMSGEMLTADTTLGANASQVYPTITTWAASADRAGMAFEFQPASVTVSIDDDTPEPGQGIVITKAGSAFVGTVVAELTDSAGTYVDVSSVLTGSGTTRTLTLPALASSASPTTVSLFDGSNATWKYIRWNTPITLRVRDDTGSDTVSLTITPPVLDHFDAVGATNDYLPAAAATSDEVYTHIAAGDGEGLPLIGGFQGNTVPSTVHFMTFDLSASPKAWLSLTSGDGVEVFDVSSGSYTGEFADKFDGTVGTNIGSHTPDADVVGTGWTGERDRSSNPAYSGDPVNLNGSGQMIITTANMGATANVGTVNPDMTVYWACTAETHRWSINARRVDENEFVFLSVRSTGLMTLGQTLGSVDQTMPGTFQYTATFVAGQTYAIRLKLLGVSAEVYLDDVLVISSELPLSANSAGTKVGIYAGGASYIGTGVLFNGVNVVSDYVAGTRTLTFSDETVTPGQAITCTVVGADFAGTIDVGTLNGVSITPSAADLNSCTITIPAMAEFDAAGSHPGTRWYQEIEVSLSDGVGVAATGTIQIVAPDPDSFGSAGADEFSYPPVDAEFGDDTYIHVASGTGTTYPDSFGYQITTTSSVVFKAFDVQFNTWRASRTEALTARTLALTDVTLTPGQTTNCTLTGSVFALDIDDVSIVHGAYEIPLSFTVTNSTVTAVTAPALNTFILNGASQYLTWETNTYLRITAGVETAVTPTTLQIVPTNSGDWATVTGVTGPYAPVGAAVNDKCYMEVISGAATLTPETFDIAETGRAIVYVHTYDVSAARWLERMGLEASFGAVRNPTYSVVKTILKSVVQ